MTNFIPAQEYYDQAKSKDLEMWLAWNKSRSSQDLKALMDQVSPIIYQEVHRASGSLPPSALSAEAKKWTFHAIQTFDPSRGVQLSTHISNYLPKVRRLNYKFQNAARLPENMQLKYHEYSKALSDLTEELNREPSEEEMSKKLGWSKGAVVKFKGSLYSDLIESASERSSEFTEYNHNAALLSHILSTLSEQERFIYDHAKSMSSVEMAAKLGVNLNRYNYLKAGLVKKIAAMKIELGM